LNEAGADDKDIQAILGHTDVSTTQAFYILPNRERAEAGMKKLAKVAQTKYGIKA
jgi:site-specific recombinase XerD